MKKFLLIAGAVLILFSGCPKKGTTGGSSRAAAGGKLVIWSFTDELANMTNNPTWGFKATHPGIEVEYSQTPSDQFQAKVDPVLGGGPGAPDIIALESAFVRKYVESGLLLDVTDIYEANKSKLLAYPVEVGSYNGKVYGMSWQAAPGALFYRRSLAKKYLGTDDPAAVQAYFSSFDKFLETAQLLRTKSNGSCVVVSSLGDLRNSFLSARRNSWVVNGKVEIDPAMDQYMDICRKLHDNRWEGRVGQWSEGWFAGMRGELKDETGKSVEVFSYFLPTWGLHYVLKTNTPQTSGDWAMCQGPSSYRWGGTWVGALKSTKNQAAAKEFIRFVGTDDAFLEAWAKETGDLVSNLNVVNKIKDTYSEPFLGGQNHYAAFAEMAKNVNGRLLQGSDEAIEAMFDEAVASYVNNEKTKDKAKADFLELANSQFGR
jgi:ABC-type glycerol-3-phosphate transport system substrate-binding protein